MGVIITCLLPVYPHQSLNSLREKRNGLHVRVVGILSVYLKQWLRATNMNQITGNYISKYSCNHITPNLEYKEAKLAIIIRKTYNNI